jgi:exodeoxyribonuclease-1
MQPTFFFYDYETTGIDPKSDRILQFAGIRTDLEFNIIDKPVVLYSKLSNEIIPNPEALIVTGITPDLLSDSGLAEPEFIAKIYKEFSTSNTCVLGYNNIRFDDEFTRYSFYRNFFDPYAREWQNNNSRFDLIDVVRISAALRPGNLKWPTNNSTNNVSFKLEDLSKANNLEHTKAHDALSDVYATIELTKLINKNNPKLFNYLLQMRKKDFVNKVINIEQIFNPDLELRSKLIVHASRMVSSEYHATSIFLPLIRDPINNNAIICWDLRYNPNLLLNLHEYTPEDISKLLYTPQTELLPENKEARLHLKTIFCNKAPAIAPISTIDSDGYQRIKLDKSLVFTHASSILTHKNSWYDTLLDFFSRKNDMFNLVNLRHSDVEHQLYDKFISNEDKYLCNRVHLCSAEKLIELQNKFNDNRLKELLFRYRARNHYNSLTISEQNKWITYCQNRLHNINNIASISFEEFINKANALISDNNTSDHQKNILSQWSYYLNTNNFIEKIREIAQLDSM